MSVSGRGSAPCGWMDGLRNERPHHLRNPWLKPHGKVSTSSGLCLIPSFGIYHWVIGIYRGIESELRGSRPSTACRPRAVDSRNRAMGGQSLVCSRKKRASGRCEAGFRHHGINECATFSEGALSRLASRETKGTPGHFGAAPDFECGGGPRHAESVP